MKMTPQHDSAGRTADQPQSLRSGQAARAAGVNLQTLRYYERRGLLSHPQRNAAGHRRYPAHTVSLLRMIKIAQRLGFSLDEIAVFLKNESRPDDIAAAAARKLAELDAQIAQLNDIRDQLARYVPADASSLRPA